MSEEEARLLTILVSVIAAAIALYEAKRARASALEERQLQILTYRREYLKDLRSWAERVLQLIGEAVFACDLDPKRQANPSFFELRHKIARDLSVLLDQGRWFLPNEKADEHGVEKPGAYRGLRPEALNAVAEAFNLVDQMSYTDQAVNKAKREGLVEAKRNFTSEVQHALDPRARNAEMEALAREIK
jgi:type II secretory pathway pseudopilin PulG